MKNEKYVLLTLTIVLLFVFGVFGPFITIWAMNTLFSLAIPYTLSTWIAVMWLGIIISPLSKRKNNNA
jgi:VIT1/CCC1 family predicted Fe2+/Mn2+ transporter